MRTAIMIAVILALLLPAMALAASPQNYCTSIQVQPPQNTGEPYVITVTAGSGSYWRVREYPAGPVVIPAVYSPAATLYLALATADPTALG